MLNTLNYIISHPLNKQRPVSALLGFLKWQFLCRIIPYPIVFPWINNSKFLAWKGLTGVTGNIYCILHEYQDMAFVLHFLKSKDYFFDVGANVGSYTILAGVAGAEVTAIEPLPNTYAILKQNIGINQFNQKIEAFNIGLASTTGHLFFTNNLDTVNHVVSPDHPNSQAVLVDTLDHLCEGKCPSLIKIDVEGFELEVLKGGLSILKNNNLKALIIELNDSGKAYGVEKNSISDLLNSYGFIRMDYIPQKRVLQAFTTPSSTGNALFIRDLPYVQERLNNSQIYKIGDLII